MRRLILLVISLMLLAIPAQGITLECGRDAFGTSEQYVEFTDQTNELERSLVLAALDQTNYDLGPLVGQLGRKITIGVEGNRSFAGRHFAIVEDNLNRADFGILLMHEIGHMHDANMLTNDARAHWASTHAEAFQYFTYGWNAPQAEYFQRPVELFAFEFSRLHRPCSF